MHDNKLAHQAVRSLCSPLIPPSLHHNRSTSTGQLSCQQGCCHGASQTAIQLPSSLLLHSKINTILTVIKKIIESCPILPQNTWLFIVPNPIISSFHSSVGGCSTCGSAGVSAGLCWLHQLCCPLFKPSTPDPHCSHHKRGKDPAQHVSYPKSPPLHPSITHPFFFF